jgi:hypothetical protein
MASLSGLCDSAAHATRRYHFDKRIISALSIGYPDSSAAPHDGPAVLFRSPRLERAPDAEANADLHTVDAVGPAQKGKFAIVFLQSVKLGGNACVRFTNPSIRDALIG